VMRYRIWSWHNRNGLRMTCFYGLIWQPKGMHHWITGCTKCTQMIARIGDTSRLLVVCQ
jgi:hypothetical protein